MVKEHQKNAFLVIFSLLLSKKCNRRYLKPPLIFDPLLNSLMIYVSAHLSFFVKLSKFTINDGLLFLFVCFFVGWGGGV